MDTLQYGVKQCAEVENYKTSAECIIAYTNIEQESGYECQHQPPPENWPQLGQVRKENLGLVYYEVGLNILKDVCFTVDSHEKNWNCWSHRSRQVFTAFSPIPHASIDLLLLLKNI